MCECRHPRAFRPILHCVPAQSLALGRGLSLACTDVALQRFTVAGSTLPACFFAHFRMPLMPVRSRRLHVPDFLSNLRHGSSPTNPLHQPTHETPMPPSAFSPLQDIPGFPSPGTLPARRAQPITAQASSPWFPARSSFPPRRPLLILGWPPDHRSRSATFYQACCSIKPLGTSYILHPLRFHVKRKMQF